MTFSIPPQVKAVLMRLREHDLEAYAVGGCVRDVLIGKEPRDWDVTTIAQPDAIQKLFPKSFYENKFGTVTVNQDGFEIQVTTYRVDERYSDKRRPDEVHYTSDLKEDLARRDFTMNAIALSEDGTLVDPFGGEKDIQAKLVRAVGNPDERFNEDALRLLRAVRLSAELGFRIEEETYKAMGKLSLLLKHVSGERVRDELIKMLDSDGGVEGVELLRQTGMLAVILPEIAEGVGVTQNKHHIYTVYEHNLLSLKHAIDQKWSFLVRLASLLHDVGKPRTKVGDGINSTFYNHDMVGSKLARQLMSRLKFPSADIDKVALLVRWHLFYYNVDEVTGSSVRRLIKNVGLENMDDLINLRIADRIGSGVPKAEPYKLRHFRYMVESVSKDPISVKMLKIDGLGVMSVLGIKPGPKVGILLSALLGEVLDDPTKNTDEYLKLRVKQLDLLSSSELSELIRKGEEKIELFEQEERKKHRV